MCQNCPRAGRWLSGGHGRHGRGGLRAALSRSGRGRFCGFTVPLTGGRCRRRPQRHRVRGRPVSLDDRPGHESTELDPARPRREVPRTGGVPWSASHGERPRTRTARRTRRLRRLRRIGPQSARHAKCHHSVVAQVEGQHVPETGRVRLQPDVRQSSDPGHGHLHLSR